MLHAEKLAEAVLIYVFKIAFPGSLLRVVQQCHRRGHDYLLSSHSVVSQTCLVNMFVKLHMIEKYTAFV